jgi:FPC/CPF motif-containing protein YcgG
MRQYLNASEAASAAVSAPEWVAEFLDGWGGTVASPKPPFPCPFAVSGAKMDQIRYLFLDPYRGDVMARQLSLFLKEARTIGPNCSLVVVSPARPDSTISDYHEKLWFVLDGLSRLDDEPWPANVPTTIDHPDWSFCFGGERVFVVCNTPANVKRRSRWASAFTLTFQPGWALDRVIGTKEKAEPVLALVRDRIDAFDAVPRSDNLKPFGDRSAREFRQYLMMDDISSHPPCPFERLGAR